MVGAMGGPSDLPTRQRAMRDAMAWSYDLLSEEEQALFSAIIVFPGDFTQEAADAIVTGSGEVGTSGSDRYPSSDAPSQVILRDLLSLVDASLLLEETMRDGTNRYQTLETIREFGRELLEPRDEAEGTRRIHSIS
jgi:predicted ATPase